MKYSITIGWLYPDLMSTYGDKGNIIVLKKRCEWRGIEVTILPITTETTSAEIEKCDLLFGGGAQDTEQAIVMRDLLHEKGQVLKKMIDKNIPALLVCGAYQIAGAYYEPAEGHRIDGLCIFDMYTKHPGGIDDRFIGNCIGTIEYPTDLEGVSIVGFENHGGRTYLEKDTQPFATLQQGKGNNGTDSTEGAVYKNAIGSYLHGALLPKNPRIADWLIMTALEVKYQQTINLTELDDSLEYQASETVIKQARL